MSRVKELITRKPQASYIHRHTALHVSLPCLHAWAESRSWSGLCSERWEQRELSELMLHETLEHSIYEHMRKDAVCPHRTQMQGNLTQTLLKPLPLSYAVFAFYGQWLQTRRTQHRRNLSNREAREFTYFKSWPQISRSTTLRAITSHFFSGPDLPLDSNLDLLEISSLFPEVFLRDLVSMQPKLWKTDSSFRTGSSGSLTKSW